MVDHMNNINYNYTSLLLNYHPHAIDGVVIMIGPIDTWYNAREVSQRGILEARRLFRRFIVTVRKVNIVNRKIMFIVSTVLQNHNLI